MSPKWKTYGSNLVSVVDSVRRSIQPQPLLLKSNSTPRSEDLCYHSNEAMVSLGEIRIKIFKGVCN